MNLANDFVMQELKAFSILPIHTFIAVLKKYTNTMELVFNRFANQDIYISITFPFFC